MSSGNLHKYFLNNGSNRLFKWLHYFDIYERHFQRFVGKECVFLEIGVFGGGSLQMWKDYLGPKAKIIGIDINPDCKAYEEDQIEIFIGSQDDKELIDTILKKYPNIDVVLDDGSHKMHHMIASFSLLYDKISPNGVYMVEDTHTCYWDNYGGGLRKKGTFMEFTKDKLDELNAVHTREKIAPTDFTRSTLSVTSYDSIVAFERRPQGKRQSHITEAL